jgi:plastocyanin
MKNITGSAILAAALAGLPTALRTPEPRASAHTMIVTSSEFSFRAPDTIASGVVTVRLVNRGKEGHQVTFARLDDSSSLTRVMRTLVDDKKHTTGVHWVGGVENALPNATSEATLLLRPGRYVIVCAYEGDDGHAHVSHGMLRALVVAGNAESADTLLPTASSIARLTNYAIDFSPSLHAERQLVRVENRGAQSHHLIVGRIVGNATAAEIDKWDGKSQPAPLEDIGQGGAILEPGQAEVIALTLSPGRYMFACILSDSASTKPHYLLGMSKEVAIK